MSEARLRRYLLMNVDECGHFCSIEAHTSQPGVPDLSYTIQGTNGWLELKFGTAVKPPELRTMQKVWIDRNIKCGGNPLIMCSIVDGPDTVFGLIHGNRANKIYVVNKTKAWIDAFNITWPGRVDWPDFLSCLKDPGGLA